MARGKQKVTEPVVEETQECAAEETDKATVAATPGKIDVSTTSKKTSRSVEVSYLFGSTIEESINLFGEDVVFSLFLAQAVIRLQAVTRSALDKTENSKDAAIEAALAWKPGVVKRGGTRKSPIDALMAQVTSGKMSAEDALAGLKERLASLEAASAMEDSEEVE